MIKATTAPQLSPGTVIDGTYTLGAVVRTRGSSATYEATDLNGDRVEVTVYAPECFVSPVALERSLRELRQLEKVASPQIVRVVDTGKMPQGGIYEVHERLGGATLAELGALPSAEVVQIVHAVAAALGVAQKAGVIHRNLGAESILRVGGDIKLFDFAVGDPQGGVSFGAIDCIAPEQVEGKNIDERTLVYNLAALTFRLLRGQPLFLAEDTGTALLQHAASLPPENSMPPQLFAALAKDPKARPALAKFLGDLDAIVREFPRDAVREQPQPTPSLNDMMRDPDAPSAKPSPAPAATPTPAPAATPSAAAPAKSIAPSVVAKPMITPPPPVGPKAAAPAVAPPPAVGPKAAAPAGAPFAPPSFAPPSVSPPSVAPPTVSAPSVAPPSAASGAPAPKPRTRGWTMFMEATDQEVTAASGPGVPVMGAPATPAAAAPIPAAPMPVAPAPAPAPAPTPTPAPAPAAAPGEVKPSTRGWTMIMDEPSEADAAALALTSPAAVTTPPPASPTTRGWTMLEELNDGLPAAATPTPAPEKSEKQDKPESGAPTSRGWTMFMEAELQGKEEGGQSEAEPEADPEFYDGQVTTESGTVVAFAPSAESPNAARAEPAPPSDGEEISSFRSRFGRGEPEAPAAAASSEPSAPQTSSELPSFTGNTSFDFGGLTPPQPQPTQAQSDAVTRREPTISASQMSASTVDAADEGEASSGGSSTKYVIIGLVVVIAIVAAIALSSS